jgi:hypothetical protein
MLVGVGQCGAPGRVGQSQMPQLAFDGGQAATNFAQRLRPPKVAEQHGHERPTTEPASMTLGPVLGDGLFKLLPGKQPPHLAENAGYSYYGGDGPPYTDYVSQRKP